MLAVMSSGNALAPRPVSGQSHPAAARGPGEVIRPATLISWARMVAVTAWAWQPPAVAPTAGQVERHRGQDANPAHSMSR
jgi:hypothetical protein